MSEKGATLKLNPIEEFAGFYLNHFLKCKVPVFHREMYRMAHEGHRRIAIAAPRSFAKSTVFSVIYPLYQIFLGNVSKILIISATADLAEQWLRMIRAEIEENDALRSDFGDLKTDKWTQDLLICQRKTDGLKIEVMAKGAGKQIRGFRPDIIVLDDLETDEGVRSEEQRAKLKDWFDKAVINTLEKDSQLIMIGTELHPLALLCDVMGREDWVVRKYQALLPDGKSLWPEKWPIDALNARRREIGELAFRSEFMNDPIISDNPIFVREWFREYDTNGESFKKIESNGLYTVVAIDPAISRKEAADYTAIVTLSATFDKEPKVYVRVGGVLRGHWPLNKQVSELDRVYRHFGAKCVVVETVAYQQALADEFRDYCEANRRFPKIVEVKPDRDKERRAHAVAPMYERGQVYFDFSDPMTQKLMDEMFLFPTGDRDDLVDAKVHALTEIKKWVKRLDIDTHCKPHIVLPYDRRNQWTGVV